MALDDEMIGSAGTLVAAGLQTAGQYVQSSIIDMMQNGLGSSLGVLLYVIAAIIAVGTIALGGHYKWGLWFLIGPALYYQVIAVRVPSSGAKWEFGDRTHAPSIVRAINEGVVTTDQPAKVSWFYSTWDTFSTEIIQAFIKALNLTDVEGDVAFISRTQRFGALFHLKVNDPELQKFINLVTLNECSDYMALQLGSEDQGRIVHEDIKAQIRAIENQPRVTETQPSYGILKQLHDQKYFGDPGPALKPVYTCREIWELAYLALQNEAAMIVGRIVAERRADGLTEEAIQAELGKKFDRFDNPLGIEYQVNMIVRAVAAKMLLEQMSEVQPNYAQLRVTRHLRKPQSLNRAPDENDHYDVSEDLRFLAGSYEYHGKGEYLSAILALPYVQGMTLYFLALTFPFFALALIVPGRYHTFLLWMGLWFWVKSWDFGFAVVMLLDKLLFTLLPHGPEISDEMVNNPDGPALIFQEILKADPTYTIHAYYNIMATAIAAVPVLTGMMVKSGGGSVLEAISQGFTNFSGKIGGSMASYARSYVAQTLAGGAERQKVREYEANVLSALMDSEVLMGLGLKTWAGYSMSAAGEKIRMVDSAGRVTHVGRDAFLKDVSKALNSQTRSYGMNLALAKFEANLAMAEWRATLSPENARRAELAVLMKYYNHDFINNDPYGALQSLAIARQNYQLGGAASGVISRLPTLANSSAGAVVAAPVMAAGGVFHSIVGAVDGDETGDVRNRRHAPVRDPRRSYQR